MRKLFVPLTVLAAAMFFYAPIMIANASYEASMGLVSKILFFHVPSWFVMFTAVFICWWHFPVPERCRGRAHRRRGG
jgi:hypothetical protein